MVLRSCNSSRETTQLFTTIRFAFFSSRQEFDRSPHLKLMKELFIQVSVCVSGIRVVQFLTHCNLISLVSVLPKMFPPVTKKKKQPQNKTNCRNGHSHLKPLFQSEMV